MPPIPDCPRLLHSFQRRRLPPYRRPVRLMFPVAVLLLWCRTRGDIKLRPSYEDVLINVPGAELVWGPG